MLYFSSGSFGSSFALVVCAELVAIEASEVRKMRRFVIEAVLDLIGMRGAVKFERGAGKRVANPESGTSNCCPGGLP